MLLAFFIEICASVQAQLEIVFFIKHLSCLLPSLLKLVVLWF